MEGTNSDVVYQDKAEVIAALKEKDISYDARLGKDKLAELLKG